MDISKGSQKLSPFPGDRVDGQQRSQKKKVKQNTFQAISSDLFVFSNIFFCRRQASSFKSISERTKFSIFSSSICSDFFFDSLHGEKRVLNSSTNKLCLWMEVWEKEEITRN